MPNNASARGYRVGYVKEVTQGTTPASALTLLRTTGGVGKVSAQTIESDEVQITEVQDLIRTNIEGSGTINFEYSYGGIHPLLEGIFGATFSTNVLKVGTTPTFFTIEDQFTDITKFMAYKGCVIEKIAISLQQGQKITGQITYRAMTVPSAASGTTAGTGGPTAAPTNPIMSPVGSIQLIQEGGSLDLKGVGVTALSIEFERPGIAQPQLGSLSLSGLDQATFTAKGSISLYMPNTTLLDKYLGDTATSLGINLGGASSLRDNYLFSKVKFTDGGPGDVSRNSPVIQTYAWQAYYDATNSTCQLTRTP
jgi:hypothetical protein